MARVTIVLEDGPDGMVDLKAEFDPPLENPRHSLEDAEMTEAQYAGLRAIQQIAEDARDYKIHTVNEEPA